MEFLEGLFVSVLGGILVLILQWVYNKFFKK